MSKKHFEAVATALHQRLIYAEADRESSAAEANRYGNAGERDLQNQALTDVAANAARVNEICDTANALSEEFSKFNHNFDQRRFLRACGIDAR